MIKKNSSRRNFIKGLFASGTSFCFLGCSNLIAEQTNEQHKFDVDSKMSFKEVFEFAYKFELIPLIEAVSQEIGREKLISLLEKTSSKMASEYAKMQASNFEKNDLATFSEQARNPNHFLKNVTSYDVVKYTDSVFELEIHECLWAKIFRESNAADIGYSCICHPDFSAAQTFNPKLKLIRTKTLMQGDECCNHRYIMET